MNKKAKLHFKAVIFDMDGVITNTMSYHFDAWLATLASVGIKVNCYDVYEREGQDGLSTIRELYKEHNRKFNLQDAKKLLAGKEELFKHSVKIKFIKGARPFLRYLKKRKVNLGLVTGTSRHEVVRIMPKDLLKLFEVTVTGDEVRKSKPNPEPFLKAIKRMKVGRKDAVVIENAPFGIQAAKRAGLFCIALETSLPAKYLRQADLICKSFRELKQVLTPGHIGLAGVHLYVRRET
ncbi:MAG: HAD family phosphatase [Candidatus Omnitrophica bacterium]|nr:HAD family phosphatase [Candidatus Omnitrophota bacterium]